MLKKEESYKMVVKLGKGQKKMERRTKGKLGQILLAILFMVSLLAAGCGKKEGAVDEAYRNYLVERLDKGNEID